jgi:hypothetical protein
LADGAAGRVIPDEAMGQGDRLVAAVARESVTDVPRRPDEARSDSEKRTNRQRRLQALLNRVSAANLHAAWETGARGGGEALVALLLAAGEALVDPAPGQLLGQLDQCRLLLAQREEVHRVELGQPAVLADRVGGRLQEAL